MTQKISTPEKRQTDDEVILQALEEASSVLKRASYVGTCQRMNKVNSKPVVPMDRVLGDDILQADYDLEGAIDLLKSKLQKKAAA